MAQILSLVNVIMGMLVAVLEYRCYRHVHKKDRWLTLLYTLVGIYWAGIYGVILWSGSGNAGAYGPLFIRPGFTFTLAVIAAGAIWRLRSLPSQGD